MCVSKERVFPSTEAVTRDGDWNGYVHSNHAAGHFNCELASSTSVTGKDSDSIAVLVLIDEVSSVAIRRDSNHAEDWSKDFFVVDLHSWLHIVDQRSPEKESF